MLSKINKLKFWDQQRMPISLKLTLIYAVVFFLAIVVISIITFSISRYLGMQRIEGYIRKMSNQIEDYIEQGKPLTEEIFKEINFDGPLNFKIYNQQGAVILKSRPHLFQINYKSNLNEITTIKEKIDFRDKRFNKHKQESNRNSSKEREDYKEVKISYLNTKVKFAGKTIYVQVMNLQHMRDDFFNILLWVLVAINIAAVFFSIIIGNYIAQKMLEPIEKINRTAQEITINNLDKRIDTKRANDELKELATTFNEMIDRLQNSIDKQKQFVADASHELRTPISVIQGYIDMLDRWGTEDKAVLEESIEAIQSETVAMKAMLEQLLFLARGDRDQYEFNKEKLELKKIVAEVYEEMKLIDDSHELKLEENKAAKIKADSKSIKQLLRIIIDNSIKYTPPEGEIIITSVVGDDYVELRIADTGCGIPEEKLDRIFDRFYRVDDSRNRDTGGAGLGLSIAKWIVDEHNGEIEVQSKLRQGTTIIIQLPINKN